MVLLCRLVVGLYRCCISRSLSWDNLLIPSWLVANQSFRSDRYSQLEGLIKSSFFIFKIVLSDYVDTTCLNITKISFVVSS